jgi:hypothetical protein
MMMMIYKQAPWTEFFVKSLAGPQLVKKFTAFYGTRKFIMAFKVPATFPILNQINPIHTNIYFLDIRFNIILPSTPRPSKWSLSLRSLRQSSVCISPIFKTCHIPRPSRYSWFDHSNKEYMLRSTGHKALRCVVFSTPCYLILVMPKCLSEPYSWTSSAYMVCSSINVREQVSHPYKTTGKIIVLCRDIYTIIRNIASQMRIHAFLRYLQVTSYNLTVRLRTYPMPCTRARLAKSRSHRESNNFLPVMEPEFHHRTVKAPPRVAISSKMNLVQILEPYSLGLMFMCFRKTAKSYY